MTTNGDQLTIGFENISPPPSYTNKSTSGDDEFILWYVTVTSPDKWLYDINASLIGSKWLLSVFDHDTAYSIDLPGPPHVDGNTISFSMPIFKAIWVKKATRW